MSGSSSSPPDAAARDGHRRTGEAVDTPLGLTVHDLPDAASALGGGQRQTRIGRLRMLLVMLVCAAPVLASYFTYYVIRPEAKRNHGELIDPQRTLPAVQARNLQGQPVPLESLRDQWLLISVGTGACDARCERHLYLQRQLREGLGREKDRLDCVWLISDDAPVPEALKPALAQGTVLRVDAAQLSAWLAPAAGRDLADHLYLVDPMGRWMMRFPALRTDVKVDAEGASKIKRDLERLLRASNSWDRAGR
ncbi:MAG: SCO family protein [Burkholderiaceae bacterium]